MSPKGENAPPALAATTMLMQEMTMNLGDFAPMASTTAPMISAVVRLSRTLERKNANDAGKPEQAAVGKIAST